DERERPRDAADRLEAAGHVPGVERGLAPEEPLVAGRVGDLGGGEAGGQAGQLLAARHRHPALEETGAPAEAGVVEEARPPGRGLLADNRRIEDGAAVADRAAEEPPLRVAERVRVPDEAEDPDLADALERRAPQREAVPVGAERRRRRRARRRRGAGG